MDRQREKLSNNKRTQRGGSVSSNSENKDNCINGSSSLRKAMHPKDTVNTNPLRSWNASTKVDLSKSTTALDALLSNKRSPQMCSVVIAPAVPKCTPKEATLPKPGAAAQPFKPSSRGQPLASRHQLNKLNTNRNQVRRSSELKPGAEVNARVCAKSQSAVSNETDQVGDSWLATKQATIALQVGDTVQTAACPEGATIQSNVGFTTTCDNMLRAMEGALLTDTETKGDEFEKWLQESGISGSTPQREQLRALWQKARERQELKEYIDQIKLAELDIAAKEQENVLHHMQLMNEDRTKLEEEIAVLRFRLSNVDQGHLASVQTDTETVDISCSTYSHTKSLQELLFDEDSDGEKEVISHMPEAQGICEEEVVYQNNPIAYGGFPTAACPAGQTVSGYVEEERTSVAKEQSSVCSDTNFASSSVVQPTSPELSAVLASGAASWLLQRVPTQPDFVPELTQAHLATLAETPEQGRWYLLGDGEWRKSETRSGPLPRSHSCSAHMIDNAIFDSPKEHDSLGSPDEVHHASLMTVQHGTTPASGGASYTFSPALQRAATAALPLLSPLFQHRSPSTPGYGRDNTYYLHMGQMSATSSSATSSLGSTASSLSSPSPPPTNSPPPPSSQLLQALDLASPCSTPGFSFCHISMPPQTAPTPPLFTRIQSHEHQAGSPDVASPPEQFISPVWPANWPAMIADLRSPGIDTFTFRGHQHHPQNSLLSCGSSEGGSPEIMVAPSHPSVTFRTAPGLTTPTSIFGLSPAIPDSASNQGTATDVEATPSPVTQPGGGVMFALTPPGSDYATPELFLTAAKANSSNARLVLYSMVTPVRRDGMLTPASFYTAHEGDATPPSTCAASAPTHAPGSAVHSEAGAASLASRLAAVSLGCSDPAAGCSPGGRIWSCELDLVCNAAVVAAPSPAASSPAFTCVPDNDASPAFTCVPDDDASPAFTCVPDDDASPAPTAVPGADDMTGAEQPPAAAVPSSTPFVGGAEGSPASTSASNFFDVDAADDVEAESGNISSSDVTRDDVDSPPVKNSFAWCSLQEDRPGHADTGASAIVDKTTTLNAAVADAGMPGVGSLTEAGNEAHDGGSPFPTVVTGPLSAHFAECLKTLSDVKEKHGLTAQHPNGHGQGPALPHTSRTKRRSGPVFQPAAHLAAPLLPTHGQQRASDDLGLAASARRLGGPTSGQSACPATRHSWSDMAAVRQKAAEQLVPSMQQAAGSAAQPLMAARRAGPMRGRLSTTWTPTEQWNLQRENMQQQQQQAQGAASSTSHAHNLPGGIAQRGGAPLAVHAEGVEAARVIGGAVRLPLGQCSAQQSEGSTVGVLVGSGDCSVKTTPVAKTKGRQLPLRSVVSDDERHSGCDENDANTAVCGTASDSDESWWTPTPEHLRKPVLRPLRMQAAKRRPAKMEMSTPEEKELRRRAEILNMRVSPLFKRRASAMPR